MRAVGPTTSSSSEVGEADEQDSGATGPNVSAVLRATEPFAKTAIDGLLVREVRTALDERGAVRELFRASEWSGAGVEPAPRWLQLNATESVRGALRGLHGETMTKLVAVVDGEALGAYVDTRPSAPSRGAVVTVRLVPGCQVLVPPGVCNGFQTVSERSTYVYCFDDEWRADMPGVAVNPLDPMLGIAWPIEPPILSAKDRGLPMLADVER